VNLLGFQFCENHNPNGRRALLAHGYLQSASLSVWYHFIIIRLLSSRQITVLRNVIFVIASIYRDLFAVPIKVPVLCWGQLSTPLHTSHILLKSLMS